MVVAALPTVRLITDATTDPVPCWRFSCEISPGGECFEAAGFEPDVVGERLELLALVRAVESLDRRSRLTIVTTSRYVRQGLTFGLEDWRTNGWRWESFGSFVPIKNCDLWQRVDRALTYHDLIAVHLWHETSLAAAGYRREGHLGPRSLPPSARTRLPLDAGEIGQQVAQWLRASRASWSVDTPMAV